MNCPYCSKEMKAGVIQSQHEIAWLPEKAKLFLAAEFNEGSIVLSEHSFLKGSCVVAYCCDECKKIIVNYSSND